MAKGSCASLTETLLLPKGSSSEASLVHLMPLSDGMMTYRSNAFWKGDITRLSRQSSRSCPAAASTRSRKSIRNAAHWSWLDGTALGHVSIGTSHDVTTVAAVKEWSFFAHSLVTTPWEYPKHWAKLSLCLGHVHTHARMLSMWMLWCDLILQTFFPSKWNTCRWLHKNLLESQNLVKMVRFLAFYYIFSCQFPIK